MSDVRPAAAVATDLERQLEPVRRALLEDAQGGAEEILAAARAGAATVVARAQAESDEAVEHARERAAATARSRREQSLSTARRAAHGSVLRAEAAVRRELAGQVHVAVEALPDDPRYPALLDRLEALAHAQLGHGAMITRDPRPGGGVIARAASRQVDYRLPALADLALDAIADDVALDESVEGEPWH